FAARIRGGELAPTIVTPLTLYPGWASAPAISPDGKMIAFTWEGERQDNIDIYVKVIGSGEPLRLTQDPAPDRRPVWSPDGRTIAFSRSKDSGGASLTTEAILTIPVLGGTERPI